MRRLEDMRARQDWLRAHRDLWHFLPESQLMWDLRKRPVDPGTFRKLREAAIADGVYSPKTFWRDMDSSLMKHMRVVREEDRIAQSA